MATENNVSGLEKGSANYELQIIQEMQDLSTRFKEGEISRDMFIDKFVDLAKEDRKIKTTLINLVINSLFNYYVITIFC